MPVTRIELRRNKGDWKESEDGNVEFGTPTDDEEVTISSQDRNREVPDFPDIDIRDEQTLSNTQREDWLLPMEPLHGARPRQTGRERPPVIDNRPPMDATGGSAVRPLSLRVHHVGYEPYLYLSLMIFRRTVYEMAVCVKRILDHRWIY